MSIHMTTFHYTIREVLMSPAESAARLGCAEWYTVKLGHELTYHSTGRPG
ncbi:hypothetical protein HNR73_006071 [Phytomonospora endophytica]|uniref:Uncharacterized protein n=1 Tax=Phytomonospora endophytica TaxID=714109 RepID=A0A841FLJ1_9ACTN|nr:hypothetical protein [Phytomonospora endophytica]